MTIERWEEVREPVAATRDTDSWVEVLAPVVDLANNICNTDFVPKDMRNSPAKVAAAVLFGRELQMAPMTSLQSIHVIRGRVGMYAETMRALIQREGHALRFVESTDTRCVMMGRRRGEDEWTKVSFTMQEAQRSGDAKQNPNYQSRPTEMLVARCTSRLARMLFPDVIKGMGATEEIEYLDAPEEQHGFVPGLDAEATVGERKPIGRRPRKARPRPSQAREAADTEGPDAGGIDNGAAPEPERRRPKLPAPMPPAEQPAPAQVEELPGEDDVEEARRKHLMRKAGMHCTRLGIDLRARLDAARRVARRDNISSTKDMSTNELEHLTDLLEHARDREALDAALEVLDSQDTLPDGDDDAAPKA